MGDVKKEGEDYKLKLNESLTNLSALYDELLLKKQIKREEENREKIKAIHENMKPEA